MQRKQQPSKSLFRESLKALEADIHHANTLAAALPRDYGDDRVEMRLSYSPLASLVLYWIEWMDYSCTDNLPSYLGLLHVLVYKVYVDGMPTMSSKEQKASLREFYAVIYPWLRQLEGEFMEFKDMNKSKTGNCKEERKNVERDDECGICMHNSTKMVLPDCGHSLCINCFRDWNERSQSCPFCRGNLKRVNSEDLWVLTGNNDIMDIFTLAKQNLSRFYLYIETLPLTVPETHSIMFDYMI
ncbi:E3 ubiquitin-protein ligase AIRP2-like [Rutidosis leptorrhynchoides]|uniref:E3 ubiquitin-protein ligase AIRP2-like n=1 Tax=Rutidosis leptorrhynchoides TaxID=125765 RepID=UPI003A993069